VGSQHKYPRSCRCRGLTPALIDSSTHFCACCWHSFRVGALPCAHLVAKLRSQIPHKDLALAAHLKEKLVKVEGEVQRLGAMKRLLRFVELCRLLIIGIYSGSDQMSVARLAAIDKTSCWRAIESLRKRDLMSVALDNKDRLSRVLRLTTAGSLLLDRAVPRSRNVQRRPLEPLDRKQQRAFLEAMQMFVEANNYYSQAPLLLKHVAE
jgi:DNA-binding MarR family transcriptional regulator